MGSVFSAIGGGIGDVTNGLTGGFSNTDQYQAPLPPIQQQQFLPQIQTTQNGYDQNTANQNALAQRILAQANGQGPNPAQSMLNQATNQNIQQANSLMASQKGINPAMAARMASQNAAMANQQAAGQASTMNAQQQLGAQSQLAGLYGTMGTQNIQQQQLLQNANAEQNKAINEGYLGVAKYNSEAAKQNAANQYASNIGLINMVGGSAMKGSTGGGDSYGGDGSFHATSAMGAPNVGPAMAEFKGGRIPGNAKVVGDSLSNDVVPAVLSPGEIVIPRSKSTDPQKAKEFIDHLMKNQGGSSEPNFATVIAAQRQLHERLEALEKRSGKGKK